MTVSNLAAVRRTLEGVGIKFIFEEDGALGVCLRKTQFAARAQRDSSR
jgi:hypothetical protein